MTCHDGTVAISALFNTPNNAGTPGVGDGTKISAANKLLSGAGAEFFGTDLSDDHPVSISITASISPGGDGQLQTAANVVLAGVRLFGAGPAFVECASCHNVHNTQYTPFLRVSNAGSQLCLICHLK